jgi:hypothetical protein
MAVRNDDVVRGARHQGEKSAKQVPDARPPKRDADREAAITRAMKTIPKARRILAER